MTIRSYQYTVQVLVTAANLDRSATSTLNLVSDAENGVKRDASSTLLLVGSPIALLQPAGITPVTTELGLTQTVETPGWTYPESALDFVSSASVNILNTKTPLSQWELSLESEVEFSYGVRNFSVEDAIGFVSSGVRAYNPEITSVISFGSEACRLFTGESDLNFVSEACHLLFFPESDLDLTHSLLLNKTLNNNLVDADVFTQACSWYVESACAKKSYASFHGEGGVEPAEKGLNYKSSFYVESIDDGTVISLRNPEVDNRERVAFNRVNRSFFDGSSDIFVDDDWAVEESQIYTIVANKREKLEPVFQFLLDNLGREIILKDWKGVTWIVIVTNPGDLYTEDGEGYWTLNFDVEGYAFDGEWFISRFDPEQAVSRAGSIYNRGGSHDLGFGSGVGRHFDVDGDGTDLTDASVVSQEVSYVIE